MLEIVFAKYGTEILIAIITAIGSALSGTVGYIVARENNKNQFVLSALKEVNAENAADKADLINRIQLLQEEFDKIKYLEIACEKAKGLIEIENESLKQEIEILIGFYGNPELLKEFVENVRLVNRKGRFFKYANIDKIYEKIIKD
ncbi:hypothetical protein [Spirulina sp. 06S082]|uniref:hypothetical protein n=1 Tax=Spirulina sp. 06S082 TaxID=3110248 RepID=UPI002B20522C|nr:hypothetical protein [Spirulina sp. 06S082]MEA5469333.1 hypothetical protein [Spirulina sp. 06S082]